MEKCNSAKSKAMTPYKKSAPAKINLFLHVVGRRPDGYHLLESLVSFLDICDEISLIPSAKTSLTLSGAFASQALHNNNIVMKAVALMHEQLNRSEFFDIHIEKNIPVAAGLGGGSADAAATMHLLNDYYGQRFSQAELEELGLTLGADVPMCLRGKPQWASGIGEILSPCNDFGLFDIVVINNNKTLSTPDVFKVFASLQTPFEKTRSQPSVHKCDSGQESPIWGATYTNNLTQAACILNTSIQDVLDTLKELEGCLVSRMSGTGSTCFALFINRTFAQKACNQLKKKWPDYWIHQSQIGAV